MIGLADRFDRLALMLLLSGAAKDPSTAYSLLQALRIHVVIGEHSLSAQKAALAVAACGSRTFLGGLTYEIDGTFPEDAAGTRLFAQLESFGAARSVPAPPEAVVIGIGTSEAAALHVFVDTYRAGVVRKAHDSVLTGCFVPAALYAGALAVGEAFQRRIFELTGGAAGDARATHRDLGVNLMTPCQSWRSSSVENFELLLPSEYWIIGAGNTGQAVSFAIGEMHYDKPEDVNVVLQDFDIATEANASTSLLTSPSWFGQRKTRMVAAHLEDRGFRPRIVEQRFGQHSRIAPDDPTLAICCLDRNLPRRSLETAGFGSIIDIGLGGRPDDCTTFRIVTFPGERYARDWYAESGNAVGPRKVDPNVRAAFASETDRCGVDTLLGQTAVGIPYVGMMAASLALAQAIRRVSTGDWVGLVDGSASDALFHVEATSDKAGLVVHTTERTH